MTNHAEKKSHIRRCSSPYRLLIRFVSPSEKAIQERWNWLMQKQLDGELVCVRVFWSRRTVLYGIDSQNISDLAHGLARYSATVLIGIGNKLYEVVNCICIISRL